MGEVSFDPEGRKAETPKPLPAGSVGILVPKRTISENFLGRPRGELGGLKWEVWKLEKP